MKILYCLTSLAHKRCFQSFVERPGLEQMIVGPKSVILENIVSEDYSDMKIRNIYQYNDISEIQGVVSNFVPDFYLQSDVSDIHKRIVLPAHCKRGFVSHGLIASYVKKESKRLGINLSNWKGFDFYFGGTNIFKEWIKFAGGEDTNIILNAIPQFDILYDMEAKSNEDALNQKLKIINKLTINKPAKILFFAGFCCRDRADFLENNEDFFKSCIELEIIAKRNNWFIFIKPRQTYEEMKRFMTAHKSQWRWINNYIADYNKIQDSKYLHFIPTSCGLYNYYSISDAILLNGCSTIEMEACGIGKPLILINTNSRSITFDSFGTILAGAAYHISDIKKLEDIINLATSDIILKRDIQKKFVKSKGLLIDGKMNERIINKLMETSKVNY